MPLTTRSRKESSRLFRHTVEFLIKFYAEDRVSPQLIDFELSPDSSRIKSQR